MIGEHKHLTLLVSLNLTETVNLSIKSDWSIGMLFQEHVVLDVILPP